VKPGETLSKLAQFYYEDFKKFPIIAKYNGLEDATQLRVGQEIRIPRLDGMDRVAGEDRNDLAAGEQDDRSETDEEAPVDQATIYRDLGVNLFMEQKYDEALIEFEKVLKTDPKDKMAIEFSYRAHYEIALALFKKKDYLTAKDQFASCLQYRADCQKCHAYIQKSEDLYKEIHYRKGIQYFEDEKLDDAIGEWKLVSAMDPDYRRTNYLIQKARTILKRVEEIKKRQAPGQDR
jgi:tetratricopeptide (TPR) repeat protein